MGINGTKKKDHAICIATTCVENTTRESRAHGDESRHRRKNLNYIQAFYDMYAEVTTKTKMFNASNTQKEYGSKTTVKTANDLHCKRTSRRRTLYL